MRWPRVRCASIENRASSGVLMNRREVVELTSCFRWVLERREVKMVVVMTLLTKAVNSSEDFLKNTHIA
jgi:hypothetical protein